MMGAHTVVAGLRKVMDENALTYADVAALCCVSVKTVESWLAAPGSAMHRKMLSRHLVLLGYALPAFLAARRTAERAAARKGG